MIDAIIINILTPLFYLVSNLGTFLSVFVVGFSPIYIFWFLFWKGYIAKKWLFIFPMFLSISIAVLMIITNGFLHSGM